MNSILEEKGGRRIKRRIRSAIGSGEIDTCLPQLLQWPKGQVIHALIALLPESDDTIKWRAVTALGFVVADLANEDLEAARTVIRRLMWSLYEESGGIGWGAPEAIGEILACHETLAVEFAHILISFMDEEGGYLEFEPLQRGVLWGIARLAQARPSLLQEREIRRYLTPYLKSNDAIVRGMAVWACGLLDSGEFPLEAKLLDDRNEIPMYWDRRFTVCTISDLTKKILDDKKLTKCI